MGASCQSVKALILATVLDLADNSGVRPLARDPRLASAASRLLAGGPALTATVQVTPSQLVPRKDKAAHEMRRSRTFRWNAG